MEENKIEEVSSELSAIAFNSTSSVLSEKCSNWSELEEKLYLFAKLCLFDDSLAFIVVSDIWSVVIEDSQAFNSQEDQTLYLFSRSLDIIREMSNRWGASARMKMSSRKLFENKSENCRGGLDRFSSSGKTFSKSLIKAISSLPLEQRFIFVLHDVVGFSRSELQAIFLTDEKSINKQITKVRTYSLRICDGLN